MSSYFQVPPISVCNYTFFCFLLDIVLSECWWLTGCVLLRCIQSILWNRYGPRAASKAGQGARAHEIDHHQRATSLCPPLAWESGVAGSSRSPGTGEGGDWKSWSIGVKAKGIPTVDHLEFKKTPASLGHPPSVSNKNSTLKQIPRLFDQFVWGRTDFARVQSTVEI